MYFTISALLDITIMNAKFHFIYILILFSLTVHSQDSKEIQAQIDSFSSIRENLGNSMDSISLEIKAVRHIIDSLQNIKFISSKNGDGIQVEVRRKTKFLKEPNVLGEYFGIIEVGEKVLGLKSFDKYYLEILYNNKKGYVQSFDIQDFSNHKDEFDQRGESFKQARLDSIKAIKDVLKDSLMQVKALQQIKYQKQFLQPLSEKGMELSVKGASVYNINSAGGADMNIGIGHLNKDKVIKYLIFEVSFYNAVGDILRCKITDKTRFRLQVTGPIEYSEDYESFN